MRMIMMQGDSKRPQNDIDNYLGLTARMDLGGLMLFSGIKADAVQSSTFPGPQQCAAPNILSFMLSHELFIV